MNELQLRNEIFKRYPKEDEHVDWKEYSDIRKHINSNTGKDIVSYVSAFANMGGGTLVIGINDKTKELTHTDLGGLSLEELKRKIYDSCVNLDSANLNIEDAQKKNSNNSRSTTFISKSLNSS